MTSEELSSPRLEFVSAVDLKDRSFSLESISLGVVGNCLLSRLLYVLIVIAVGI